MILYSGGNIKLKVFEKLRENNLIRCYWEKLTRSVGNQNLKEKLKVKIVTKWNDIRVNALIKNIGPGQVARMTFIKRWQCKRLFQPGVIYWKIDNFQ